MSSHLSPTKHWKSFICIWRILGSYLSLVYVELFIFCSCRLNTTLDRMWHILIKSVILLKNKVRNTNIVPLKCDSLNTISVKWVIIIISDIIIDIIILKYLFTFIVPRKPTTNFFQIYWWSFILCGYHHSLILPWWISGGTVVGLALGGVTVICKCWWEWKCSFCLTGFVCLSVQWIRLGFSGALLFSGSTGPHSRAGILDGL